LERSTSSRLAAATSTPPTWTVTEEAIKSS
jgi:hypothetical protein